MISSLIKGIDGRKMEWNRKGKRRWNHSVPHNREGHCRVVLIGWLGCSPRALSKYDHCWKNFPLKNSSVASSSIPLSFQSIQTISIIPPMHWILFPKKAKKKANQFVEDQLKDFVKDHKEGDKLLFHSFSANGPHFHGHLLPFMKESNGFKVPLDGCIWDSGPPYDMDHVVFARGFVGAFLFRYNVFTKAIKLYFKKPPTQLDHSLKKSQVKEVQRPIYEHWFLTPITEFFFKLLLRLPNIQRNLITVRKQLMNQSKTPQLILYSKADDLLTPDSIEKSISEMEEYKFPVKTVKFENSPHVSHLMVYPNEYKNEICNWIEKEIVGSEASSPIKLKES